LSNRKGKPDHGLSEIDDSIRCLLGIFGVVTTTAEFIDSLCIVENHIVSVIT